MKGGWKLVEFACGGFAANTEGGSELVDGRVSVAVGENGLRGFCAETDGWKLGKAIWADGAVACGGASRLIEESVAVAGVAAERREFVVGGKC